MQRAIELALEVLRDEMGVRVQPRYPRLESLFAFTERQRRKARERRQVRVELSG